MKPSKNKIIILNTILLSVIALILIFIAYSISHRENNTELVEKQQKEIIRERMNKQLDQLNSSKK